MADYEWGAVSNSALAARQLGSDTLGVATQLRAAESRLSDIVAEMKFGESPGAGPIEFDTIIEMAEEIVKSCESALASFDASPNEDNLRAAFQSGCDRFTQLCNSIQGAPASDSSSIPNT